MKLLLVTSLTALISGCVSVPSEYKLIDTEPREFTYDYVVPGKTQTEIFQTAQQHFAVSYGDIRSVQRSANEVDGTFIGKALVNWTLLKNAEGLYKPAYPVECTSDYSIIFIAKDGKARMQLSLTGTASPLSKCQGWPVPTKSDYPQVVESFNAASKRLESALKGNSKIDSLRNF